MAKRDSGHLREVIVFHPQTDQERRFAIQQARNAGITAMENVLEHYGIQKIEDISTDYKIEDEAYDFIDMLGIREVIEENSPASDTTPAA